MVCAVASKPRTALQQGMLQRQRATRARRWTGLLVLALSAYANGQELPTAHVHGQGTLTVAMEGNDLEINFDSAAMNLLGFEHRASSPTEKQQVIALRQQLSEVAQRLRLQGGQCQLREQWTSIDERLEPETDKHAEHDEARHRDISARYRFHCTQPSTLRGLRTDLLSQYPALVSLSVQWLIEGRQGALTLDNSRDDVSFR